MLAEHPFQSENYAWLLEVSHGFESCPACETLNDIAACQPLADYSCSHCAAPLQAMGRFGNLEVQSLIGVGGMSSVFIARDTILDRVIALKVLTGEAVKDPARRHLLLREAMLTASITHPNVVRVFDAGTLGNASYVAMELLENGTLGEVIDRSGALPEAKVTDFGIQISNGLRAAFLKGLLHRDVKPGNILFRDAATVTVTDFGLALTSAQARTAACRWGTPHYISPERAAARPEDVRSDIYSFGATLFHALTGRVPFEGDDADEVARKQSLFVAPSVHIFAPHVSEATAQVIAKTLQRDPAHRFQNYDELIQALQGCRLGQTKPIRRHVRSQARTPAAEKPHAQGGSALALAATVAIVAAVAGLIWFQGKQEAPASTPAVSESSEVAVGNPPR